MRAIILLALVGTALAVPRNQNRIAGGSDTTIEEYPYMANMQYGWFGIMWIQACGGSLITSTAVLSAAHCYYGDRPSDWQVLLGTSLASGGGNRHAVAQLILHANYNTPSRNNDIAIVRLATPAVLSATVRTARIPGRNYNVPDGTVVTAIGWGSLWSDGPYAELLQHVDLNIINQALCAERYAYLNTQPGLELWPDITDGMLCAGILDVGGKAACQGDSGGPLAHDRDIIVGITSWGLECANAFYPGVNVRVSQYTDWIVANA